MEMCEREAGAGTMTLCFLQKTWKSPGCVFTLDEETDENEWVSSTFSIRRRNETKLFFFFWIVLFQPSY